VTHASCGVDIVQQLFLRQIIDQFSTAVSFAVPAQGQLLIGSGSGRFVRGDCWRVVIKEIEPSSIQIMLR
jgi:hypothetical protein